jgi:hypothetical protein
MKLISLGIILFVLSYSFHPMNDIMRGMLKTDVHQMMLRLSVPELLHMARAVLKFVGVAMAIGFPCVFVAFSWNKHIFLRVGLLFGLVSALVGVLHFVGYEKDQLMRMAWFMVAPIFIAAYFLLGFIVGGLWALLGSMVLR